MNLAALIVYEIHFCVDWKNTYLRLRKSLEFKFVSCFCLVLQYHTQKMECKFLLFLRVITYNILFYFS